MSGGAAAFQAEGPAEQRLGDGKAPGKCANSYVARM